MMPHKAPQGFRFRIRQLFKMVLQNWLLPSVYAFWRTVYNRRVPDFIVLADSHHDSLPYSMENLYTELVRRGYDPILDISDYGKLSAFRSSLRAIRFMKLYAQARYVFLCDNFLPVVSCRKRPETTVVQLWHSCGLLKKIGYDTTEDIPAGYRGSVYRNYDLVTVSAPSCVTPFARCMRLPESVVKPLGISRTDNYFSESWIRSCREEFYHQYPQAAGKRIVIWAPTFRGNAADPYLVGTEAIQSLAQEFSEDWFFLIKVHPHIDRKQQLSNCSIPTERLFPVADLLITDYSSTVCEFMMFRKPYVLFAPDLEEFRRLRGFHVPYESLSPYIATDAAELKRCVLAASRDKTPNWIDPLCNYHNGSCDGHSTQRLLDHLEL